MLNEKGILIALIKPQFEAEKHEVDAGKGIITNPEIHQRILEDLSAFVRFPAPFRNYWPYRFPDKRHRRK